MRARLPLAIASALAISAAIAQQPAPLPNPHAGFHKAVQERLQALGFYEGPVNGDIGPVTQAAIAQFQLSHIIPATGMPDAETVAALGLEPPGTPAEAQASATGATAEPAQPAPAQ